MHISNVKKSFFFYCPFLLAVRIYRCPDKREAGTEKSLHRQAVKEKRKRKETMRKVMTIAWIPLIDTGTPVRSRQPWMKLPYRYRHSSRIGADHTPETSDEVDIDIVQNRKKINEHK
ncbi:MAG: hypothetical protein CW338_06830 [Clostridiales bacterium]|nr:hypothetical protein [Clostridiales bacterium]